MVDRKIGEEEEFFLKMYTCWTPAALEVYASRYLRESRWDYPAAYAKVAENFCEKKTTKPTATRRYFNN